MWRTDFENMPKSTRYKVPRPNPRKEGTFMTVQENNFIHCLTKSKCGYYIATRYLPEGYNGNPKDGGYWEFYSPKKPIEEQIVAWFLIPSIN